MPFLEHSFSDAGATTLASSHIRRKASTPAAAPAAVDRMTEDEQLAMALAMSAEGQHADAPGEDAVAVQKLTPEEVQQEAAARVPPEPAEGAEGAEGVARVGAWDWLVLAGCARVTGFRLPEGRRLQRRFLLQTPMQALYDLCLSESAEAASGRSFVLADSVPGASCCNDVVHVLQRVELQGRRRWRTGSRRWALPGLVGACSLCVGPDCKTHSTTLEFRVAPHRAITDGRARTHSARCIPAAFPPKPCRGRPRCWPGIDSPSTPCLVSCMGTNQSAGLPTSPRGKCHFRVASVTETPWTRLSSSRLASAPVRILRACLPVD